MTCNCKVCTQNKIDMTWYNLLPENRRGHAMDLLLRLESSENDCDYYRAIIDGSWPEADRIISESRKKGSEDNHV